MITVAYKGRGTNLVLTDRAWVGGSPSSRRTFQGRYTHVALPSLSPQKREKWEERAREAYTMASKLPIGVLDDHFENSRSGTAKSRLVRNFARAAKIHPVPASSVLYDTWLYRRWDEGVATAPLKWRSR